MLLLVLANLNFLEFISFLIASIVISLVAILFYYGFRALGLFVDFHVAKLASRFQKTHFISYFYIQRKTKTKFPQILQENAFSELARFDWQYLKLTFEIFHLSPELMGSMSPYGQKLIKDCYESGFSHEKMIVFVEYYERPLQKIINAAIQGKITDEKILQRIIFEHTPEQRRYLEEHLPNSHPIMQKISQESQIQINADFKILK